MGRTQADFSEILRTLRDFAATHRRFPSYAEIAKLFTFASKNAAFKLAQKLIAAGFLAKDETGRLHLAGPGLGVRLAGTIQAGFPSPAEEDLLDTVSLNEFLVEKPEASFLLKVTGDSMKDAGIMPEDLVVIERGQPAQNGDIVLAEVDGEWTLKYYRCRNGDVFLQAANPNYPDIYPETQLSIGGVLRAVIRRYA